MAVTYLTPGGVNPAACPQCKNPNYIYTLTNPGVLNAQTNAGVAGTVYHCDNCQHNFSNSTTEF